MSAPIQPIREWQDVTRERFEDEIRPLRQPAVFRNLCPDWPLVARGRESTSAVVTYLNRFYSGKQIGTISVRPSEQGRIFYNEGLNRL